MISIIVPVYNVEKYIVKCLESIVNQDYKNFELLIVNDGAKDDSIKLADDYLKDKDINYQIINKENGGLASARNAGIRKAKGDAIAFVDSDDCLSKDFLGNLYNALKNNDFSFCNFTFVKEQKEPIDNNDLTIKFNKEELLNTFLKRKINFVVPSMMFRKDYLINNNLFFNEEIKFSEDQPFIWNVILHSNKSIYLYKKMYGYCIRENSIMTSSSKDKVIKSYNEYKNYINQLFNNFEQYKNIKELIIPRWQLGTLYTSARMLKYEDYKDVYDLFDGKTLLKRLSRINEKKTYVLALVSSMSCKLLYKLCNRINLNK